MGSRARSASVTSAPLVTPASLSLPAWTPPAARSRPSRPRSRACCSSASFSAGIDSPSGSNMGTATSSVMCCILAPARCPRTPCPNRAPGRPAHPRCHRPATPPRGAAQKNTRGANQLEILRVWPYHGCMTSVPDRSRVRLPGISSRAYEHPADRSALVALRKLTGFDVLLRRLAGLFNERAMRLDYLASGVKASQEQFPQLYQMMLDGAYVLDLPTVPELFISQDPTVNAMTLGTDKPFIVITTGLVDLYDAAETRWVIGHELGHVLSGHAVYRTMLYHLINL